MAIKTCNVRLWLFPVISVLLVSSGCVHVDITVELHDKDPGATVTERLCVTRKLKELCPTGRETSNIMVHLEKKSALERLKYMGKGATLVSHNKKDLPDGSSESIAVYSVANIENLRFSNPWIGGRPSQQYRLALGARVGRAGKKYGLVSMQVKSVNRRRDGLEKGTVTKASTPLERERYRLLKPVVADLLSDLDIALRVTVPTRFTGGRVRGLRGGVKTMTLLSLSGKDLDRSGRKFFDNEEVMIRIMQMDLKAGVVFRNSQGARSPRLRHGRGYHAEYFTFIPTEYFKKKYFEKK